MIRAQRDSGTVRVNGRTSVIPTLQGFSTHASDIPRNSSRTSEVGTLPGIFDPKGHGASLSETLAASASALVSINAHHSATSSCSTTSSSSISNTTLNSASTFPTSNPPTQPIRFKTHLRNTVYDMMRGRGWKETEGDKDWDFYWADVHWVHETFDTLYLLDSQRINHFRNHYELTRKDLLVKNVKRTIKSLKNAKQDYSAFEFLPPSYTLPSEHALFTEEFKRQGGLWIMKPVGKAQGKGIFLINKMSQISAWKKRILPPSALNGVGSLEKSAETSEDTGPEAYIIQKYIDNPYLIGGRKFDLRIYVLVTSYSPLTVYIHRNGFCRFSGSLYSTDAKELSNLYIHATNVAIQKKSPTYSSANGCKWPLRSLRQYMYSHENETKTVNDCFKAIETIILKSLQSVKGVMMNDKHCFEIYGYDILIDDKLRPWLLEVNASPSLTAETQFDYDLKYNMLNDAFDILDLEKRRAPATTSSTSNSNLTSSSSLNGSNSSSNNNKGSEKVTKMGGFDLVYLEGDGGVPEKGPPGFSHLGAFCPIDKQRQKKRFSQSGHGQ